MREGWRGLSLVHTPGLDSDHYLNVSITGLTETVDQKVTPKRRPGTQGYGWRHARVRTHSRAFAHTHTHNKYYVKTHQTLMPYAAPNVLLHLSPTVTTTVCYIPLGYLIDD